MKTIICLLIFTLSFNSFADVVVITPDCDWSMIVDNKDGTYTYSSDLNLCVGKLVQDSKIKDQQITDLNSAVQLKDLALTTADQRTALWRKTSEDEQDRMLKLNSDESKSNWIMFTLGALTVLGSGYVAAKLIHP